MNHFLLSAILLVTTPAFSQWSSLPSGTSNMLQSVYFTDALTGYCTGNGGTILKTINGGSNWSPQISGTVNDLFEVYFPAPDTGYAVGWLGTALKTTDGGANWTALTSGTVSTLFSVTFLDSPTGYIAGDNGGIFKTINGGQNWVQQTSGTTNTLLFINFSSSIAGYAAGFSGTILKTTLVSAVSEINDLNFSLTPNPASDKITLSLPKDSANRLQLNIYDSLGNIVLSETQHQQQNINIGHLSNGVYLIEAVDRESSSTKRLAIQH